MGYLLDTDICIFFLKGRYGLIEKINKVGIENCYLSEITIAELKYGAAKSSDYEKHSEEVEMLEESFIILPIYDSLDKYAEERARLEKIGNKLPDFDLLIGCTSIKNNLIMVTNNEKHLSHLEGVKIENWKDSKYNEYA